LFGSGYSFHGVTRQGDDEFGEFIPRCRETEFQFCFSGFLNMALSVGSGPRSAASIRLFSAARFSRMSDSIFGLRVRTRKPDGSKRIRPPTGRKRERPHISPNFGSKDVDGRDI
jgi:hypothetical protein